MNFVLMALEVILLISFILYLSSSVSDGISKKIVRGEELCRRDYVNLTQSLDMHSR